MNNYLIVSSDTVVINNNIDKIISKYKDYTLITYDLENTYIEKAIEDLDTINFLDQGKIVILKNALFMSSLKQNLEQNTDILLKYLNNPNNSNVLIIITPNISSTKKINKEILKLVNKIDTNIDINSLIKNYLKDYKINNNTINKLIEYTKGNNELLFNELDKLILYKYDTKEIKEDDVELITTKILDDNIFHFIDSILSKNKEYSFKLYNNFRLNGVDITDMIRILSSKIRLFYQVRILVYKGYKDKEIAEILKSHEYPIKLAHQKINDYNEKILINYLYKLSMLDLNIKKGLSDGVVEFEELLASI